MRVRPFLILPLCVVALLGACSKEAQASEQAESGFVPVEHSGDAVPAPAAQPAAQPVVNAAAKAPPAAPEVAKSAPRPQAAAGKDDGIDVALAGVVAHRPPAELQKYLQGEGRTLPPERRNLALAFALALGGSKAEAKTVADDLDAEALTASERAALDAVLGSSGAKAPPVSVAGERALARAMYMRLIEREAAAQAEAKALPQAARLYSALLVGELSAPWPPDHEALVRWTQALVDAQAGNRWSVKAPWPAFEIKVQQGDSLTAIRKRALAQKPELAISTGLIQRSNQMKSETSLHPGDTLRIPLDRVSVEVHVGARWMLYFLGDEVAYAWEIGVGKDGSDTPPGTYTVGPKQKNPMWFRPGKEPVAFGNPENPLGTRWIPWLKDQQKTSIGFHGTNDEAGVGGRVSQGCVRMRNADVELLYEILPEGAQIRALP